MRLSFPTVVSASSPVVFRLVFLLIASQMRFTHFLDGTVPRYPSRTHRKGGVVREGAAPLPGVGVCGHRGRRLSTHYRGRNSTPGYHCAGKNIAEGRGLYCLNVGGVAIDEAVAQAFLEAVTPAAVDAMKTAVEQAHGNHDTALMQWRLEIERLRYEAGKAERRYRAVEPENRLVARGLEADWECKLRELAKAEADLRRRESQRLATVGPDQLDRIRVLINQGAI